jgi:hypothetical protein
MERILPCYNGIMTIEYLEIQPDEVADSAALHDDSNHLIGHFDLHQPTRSYGWDKLKRLHHAIQAIIAYCQHTGVWCRFTVKDIYRHWKKTSKPLMDVPAWPLFEQDIQKLIEMKLIDEDEENLTVNHELLGRLEKRWFVDIDEQDSDQ